MEDLLKWLLAPSDVIFLWLGSTPGASGTPAGSAQGATPTATTQGSTPATPAGSAQGAASVATTPGSTPGTASGTPSNAAPAAPVFQFPPGTVFTPGAHHSQPLLQLLCAVKR